MKITRDDRLKRISTLRRRRLKWSRLNIYKGLTILSRYFSCQDSEFRSAMGTSSVDIEKLLGKNFFLWIQCPKISLLLFKDGADLRMESFSCKQSPHILFLGANGFTLLTSCHLILKLMYICSDNKPCVSRYFKCCAVTFLAKCDDI